MRDLHPDEAEGVTVAVETLVVVEDRLGDLGVEPVAGHGKSQLRVALHQLTLVLVEGPGLAEDPGVEMDLAHIVQDAGQGETVEVVLSEPEPGSQIHCEV